MLMAQDRLGFTVTMKAEKPMTKADILSALFVLGHQIVNPTVKQAYSEDMPNDDTITKN